MEKGIIRVIDITTKEVICEKEIHGIGLKSIYTMWTTREGYAQQQAAFKEYEESDHYKKMCHDVWYGTCLNNLNKRDDERAYERRAGTIREQTKV